jgi:hypothetical protein
MDLVLEPNDILFFAGRSAILLVALLAFSIAFSSWRRATVRGTERLQADLATALDLLKGFAATQAAQADGLAVRLESLERRIDARAQLNAAAAAGSPRGYELALRLARNGATQDEIAESSGVTRQEAQLLVRLHGPKRSA